jgi:hypothetical protein
MILPSLGISGLHRRFLTTTRCRDKSKPRLVVLRYPRRRRGSSQFGFG